MVADMPHASAKIAPVETEAGCATKKNPKRAEPWTKKNIRGQGAMRFWQLTCFAAVFAVSPLCVTVVAKIPADQSNLAAGVGVTEQPPSFFILSAAPATFSQRFSVLLQEEELSSITSTRRKLG